MPVVQDSTLVRAPQEPLFRLLQDYALRLRWDPFLREMRFLDGATEAAVGVRTWVRAWTGLTMETVYTTLSSPSVVAMKMTRGPFFFGQFAGSWRLEPAASEDRTLTKVTFRYSFTTRWPIVRRVLDPVIAGAFHRDIQGRLRGLKRGAEDQDPGSGSLVGAGSACRSRPESANARAVSPDAAGRLPRSLGDSRSGPACARRRGPRVEADCTAPERSAAVGDQ